MLRKTIFISEPTDTRYRGGLYTFRRDDPEDDILYCCNGDEATIRKIENKILEATSDETLLKLIYEYGEALLEDARGDYAENSAGEGI